VSVHGTLFEKKSYRETFKKVILGNLIDGVLEVMAHMNRPDEISILKDRAREVERELAPDLAEILIDIIWNQTTFMDTVSRISGEEFIFFSVQQRLYRSSV
jgi:hypothetical protein